MRVLVVEDDENLRLAVTMELARAGFEVQEAGEIASAAEKIRAAEQAKQVDCVVFDRMLPDGDAIDFVHRRRQAGWSVPVLFLTARDSIADLVAGFEHGGDDYLVKP